MKTMKSRIKDSPYKVVFTLQNGNKIIVLWNLI